MPQPLSGRQGDDGRARVSHTTLRQLALKAARGPSGGLTRRTVCGMAVLPLPTPPLADCAVALRPWRERDIPAQLAAFGDALFERFSDWPPRTEADARRYLKAHEAARVRGEQLELALVEPHDHDVVLGGASLSSVSLPQGRASIGYWLAPDARGRGLATRAVRLLASWAFDALRIERLELTCGPDNHASQRVAERCGFTREGLLRSHMPLEGSRRDTVVFSLLPGELR
jgi:RimJ/RimL family protein N-acetyltransferase